MMIDTKLLQSIGNVVARDLRDKYPTVVVRFFALKGWSEMRVYIADRNDPGGSTGRLYDLGMAQQPELFLVKDITRLLEGRIEQQVRDFIKKNPTDTP
jgi:hypothetical protein